MTSMDAFEKEYGYNSYRIIQRGDENVIRANYHDIDSGWIFVEEQNIDSLLQEGIMVIWRCLTVVVLGCLLAGALAYLRVRRVTYLLMFDATSPTGDR